ncbi:MAG: hypothetical protein SVV03_04725 [Candidatus Nanohaloarchaea archaeon]|nr:hypothetical protein [Candidatus Nanohaloarchaea archaeon]
MGEDEIQEMMDEYIADLKSSDLEDTEVVDVYEDKDGRFIVEKEDYVLSAFWNGDGGRDGDLQKIEKIPFEAYKRRRKDNPPTSRDWLYSEDRFEWVEFLIPSQHATWELHYKQMVSNTLSEESRAGSELTFHDDGELWHIRAMYREQLPEINDSEVDASIDIEELEDIVEVSFEVDQEEVYKEEIDRQGATPVEKLEELQEEFS